MDGNKLAYSVEEACQALGIGQALAYELIMSGLLHSIKVGARRLIPASAEDSDRIRSPVPIESDR